MNSNKSIWSDLPLSTGIATLVCYAGVFNDVIGVEELASTLGVSGQDEFSTALEELHLQRKLILKDGFAGLPDLEDKIAIKGSKIATAHQLINARLDDLRKLGRSPMIKFVGISGSLAANNPNGDRNHLMDMDLFMITRSQCLWRYNVLRGIRTFFSRSKQEPQLCINYIMDEENLLITNRNLFTATEIRKLIPVSGLDAYRKFLQVNNWVDYYYPRVSGASAPVDENPSSSLSNKFFYVLYAMLRSIRWLSLDPLRELSFKTGPHLGSGLNLFRSPYGGYQAMVCKKFSRLAETWFPELLNAELIVKLFPDELSTEIIKGAIIDLARIIEHTDLESAYSKYGWQDILPKSG